MTTFQTEEANWIRCWYTSIMIITNGINISLAQRKLLQNSFAVPYKKVKT